MLIKFYRDVLFLIMSILKSYLSLVLILASSFHLYSCRGYNPKQTNNSQENSNWEMTQKVTYRHQYLPNGLLDSSFASSGKYYKGLEIISEQSVIARIYNNHKQIINTKETVVTDKGIKSVIETIKRYDNNDSLIEEIMFLDGELHTKNLFEYSKNGTQERLVLISKKSGDALQHFNDDKYASNSKTQYDTTVFVYNTSLDKQHVKITEEDAGGNILGVKTKTITDNKGSFIMHDEKGKLIEENKVKEERDGKYLKRIDGRRTSWYYNGKEVIQEMSIPGTNSKFRYEYTYNEHGDVIQSIDYKQ